MQLGLSLIVASSCLLFAGCWDYAPTVYCRAAYVPGESVEDAAFKLRSLYKLADLKRIEYWRVNDAIPSWESKDLGGDVDEISLNKNVASNNYIATDSPSDRANGPYYIIDGIKYDIFLSLHISPFKNLIRIEVLTEQGPPKPPIDAISKAAVDRTATAIKQVFIINELSGCGGDL